MEIWQIIFNIVTVLIGGGGIVALVKARSEVRNNNKAADIAALEQTIDTLQSSYEDTLGDYKNRCNDYDKRIQFLETEYVKQAQQINDYRQRISDLEIELNKANHRIEFLEDQLHKRDIEIMRLQEQNIELRQRNGERVGLETK